MSLGAKRATTTHHSTGNQWKEQLANAQALKERVKGEVSSTELLAFLFSDVANISLSQEICLENKYKKLKIERPKPQRNTRLCA